MSIKTGSQNIKRTGKTTRLVDKAIQTLFKKGEVKIKDHEDTPYTNNKVFDRVVNRLSSEHRVIKVNVNRQELTIELVINKTQQR